MSYLGRKKLVDEIEAVAVGKACCARLYSYSRLRKSDALIALGSHQGVLNFSDCEKRISVYVLCKH